MAPDPTSAAKKTYRAGDTLTTKLTLKPDPDRPTSIQATFTLTPLPSPQNWDMNRTASFSVGNWMMPPTPGSAVDANLVTLTGQIPHHILGGTYKPTSVTFGYPNNPSQTDSNPDPDGDLVITVEDDPVNPIAKPVIEDFDLA